MLTVVFGLFHGLVLLPVLLSLVGSKTEIEADVEDEVVLYFFFINKKTFFCTQKQIGGWATKKQVKVSRVPFYQVCL